MKYEQITLVNPRIQQRILLSFGFIIGVILLFCACHGIIVIREH